MPLKSVLETVRFDEKKTKKKTTQQRQKLTYLYIFMN